MGRRVRRDVWGMSRSNRLIGVSGHEGEVRGAAPESLAR